MSGRSKYKGLCIAWQFILITHGGRFAREPRWSETGDRYIIKLFRDFVFHQVDEAGNPVVNLSHVLTCLSKVRFMIHVFQIYFADASIA